MASYLGSASTVLVIGALSYLPCQVQAQTSLGTFVVPLNPPKAEVQSVEEWSKQTTGLANSTWTESNEANRQRKLFEWAERTPAQLAYVTRILQKNDNIQTGKVAITLKDLFAVISRVNWQGGDQPYLQRIVATWSAIVPQLIKNMTVPSLSATQRRNLEQALVDLVKVSKDAQIGSPVLKQTWLNQISSLAQMTRHQKTSVRLSALSILEALGTYAIPASSMVQQSLSDPDRFVRWAAVRTLQATGIDATTRQILVKLEQDEDISVRQAVQQALQLPTSNTDSIAKTVQPPLDLNIPTRRVVPDKELSVPATTTTTSSPSPAELIHSPASIKPAAPAMLPVTMPQTPLQMPATKSETKSEPVPLFSPPPTTQAPARQVTENKNIQPISSIAPVRAEHRSDSVAVWIPRLRTGTANQQVQAVRELGKLGAGAASAVPTLAESLLKGNVEVRREVPLALMKIGAPAKLATSVLERSLQDSDTDVKVNAARALLELSDK